MLWLILLAIGQGEVTWMQEQQTENSEATWLNQQQVAD